MSSKRYTLQTNDYLVLRDGKPFGAEKNWGASSYNWLQPQTLAGMLRTAAGFAVSPDYFASKENQQAILQVGIQRILTGVINKGKKELLAVPPADVLFTAAEKDETLKPHFLKFAPLQEGEGMDIANPDWLVPTVDTQEKPAKSTPAFWFWDNWQTYALKGPFSLTQGDLKTFGVPAPVIQERVHNALSSETRTTIKGQLFANKNLYFYTSGSVAQELFVSFEATGISPEMEQGLGGSCYLGGDRKTVNLTSDDVNFPVFPAESSWANQKFLKLVLMTGGNWGGWCPDWLKPDLQASTIPFVKVPGHAWSVRLRSACIVGWEGISGWDTVKRAPKALKKLVKPGAVYLLELENPADSEAVAKHFWGSSLCKEEEAKEGYGLVFPALALQQI